MWLRHARTSGSELAYDPHGNILRWSAEHDGYEALDPPATHRRTVSLDEAERRVEIFDEIANSGPEVARMAFHLGPQVSCRLDGNCAWLSWPAGDGTELDDLKLDGPKRLLRSWSCPVVSPGQPTAARRNPSSVGTPQASGGSSRRP